VGIRVRVAMQKGNWGKYLFVVPGIVWILMFTVFPLLYALRLSFTDAYLDRPRAFVGLANYARALGDDRWQAAVTVTVLFVVASVSLTLVLGLSLAWLLNRPIRGFRVFRAIFTMPIFTAPIALGYLGLVIFHETGGPINNLLMALGVGTIPWFTQPFWARLAIISVDVWQWTPFGFIVFLAAMQSIPEELYEATKLDTSSKWQTFRYMTLPLIAPALATVAILRLVVTFKVMEIPFALTAGGPGLATQTYAFYTYMQGWRNFHYGYAASLAFILLGIVLIFTILYFSRARHLYE
jgi:multiple sugar transport system permease protein